jgi:predicted membrane protein
MADMALQTAAVFSAVNVLLLIGLMVIYGNSFRKVRAEFTLGLLFFSSLFLVQNLLAVYSYAAMFMFFAAGAGPLVLAIAIVQTAGLAVLFWLSVR